MEAIVGAGLGLATAVLSNGLRRQPLMHRPWNHALFMGIGGFGYKQFCEYREWDKEMGRKNAEYLGEEIPASLMKN